MVKRLSTMRETRVHPLGWEDPLEKEMAIHSSILAWKIPWMEEPGRLQSLGSQRVRHNFTFTSLLTDICIYTHIWRRQWQPTPVLLPRKSHRRRSLVGYSPWGHKESDTTERLHSQHLVESVTSQLKEIHEPLFCVLQAECHLWRISKESLQFTRTFYQTVIIISTNFLNILCL